MKPNGDGRWHLVKTDAGGPRPYVYRAPNGRLERRAEPIGGAGTDPRSVAEDRLRQAAREPRPAPSASRGADWPLVFEEAERDALAGRVDGSTVARLRDLQAEGESPDRGAAVLLEGRGKARDFRTTTKQAGDAIARVGGL